MTRIFSHYSSDACQGWMTAMRSRSEHELKISDQGGEEEGFEESKVMETAEGKYVPRRAHSSDMAGDVQQLRSRHHGHRHGHGHGHGKAGKSYTRQFLSPLEFIRRKSANISRISSGNQTQAKSLVQEGVAGGRCEEKHEEGACGNQYQRQRQSQPVEWRERCRAISGEHHQLDDWVHHMQADSDVGRPRGGMKRPVQGSGGDGGGGVAWEQIRSGQDSRSEHDRTLKKNPTAAAAMGQKDKYVLQ
jgi:hypothetical protein